MKKQKSAVHMLIAKAVESHTIGLLGTLPQLYGDSRLIKEIESSATSAGADGCIFVATYADGSILWGFSNLDMQLFLASNISQQFYCGPSNLSIPASLLKNLNAGKLNLKVYLTKDTASLRTSMSHIPKHPPIEEIYTRYINSKHFKSFSSATQITFSRTMEICGLSSKQVKIAFQDILNPNVLAQYQILNSLSALEAVTGICVRKIPKLRKSIKSEKAYRPSQFSLKPIITNIEWANPGDSKAAA